MASWTCISILIGCWVGGALTGYGTGRYMERRASIKFLESVLIRLNKRADMENFIDE